MVTFPNIKINIGLNITRKREDGFHDIETIFYPVDHRKDRLEITLSESGESSIIVHNAPELAGAHDNLCFKAYELLKKEYDLPGVSIHLTKNIPIGAGLGGGSADAAFTLIMLDQLFSLGLQKEDLKRYALLLGSDVPFFIENRPAYATGKGELLTPVDVDLSEKVITIVKPDIFISTAEAYAGVEPKTPDATLKELVQLPVSEWKDHIKNDFEVSVFKKHPLLGEIKQSLYQKGAEFVSLSGSGSALFAISNKEIAHEYAL